MNNTPDFVISSTAEELDQHYKDVPLPGPNKPRVLFPSNLKLTREQEDKLCQTAKRWHELLDDQLGRGDTAMDGMNMPSFLSGINMGGGGSGETKPERKFLEKRLLFQMVNENKMDFRKILNPHSIFAKSNLVVPLARRIASQMGARAVNYFFGTDPWLAQYPLGGEGDKALAQKLQKLTDAKFRESGSLNRLRRAVINSFVVGESILKVTYANRRDFYRRMETVAVDGAGNPILAQDGEPITQEDTFAINPMDPAGPSVLERDNITIQPQPLVFKTILLDQENVHYEGPEVTQVYYRDFLCPENAPSVQDAECVIHIMAKTASEMAQAYMQSPASDLEGIQRAVEGLQDALGGGNEYMTGDMGARPEQGQLEAPQGVEPITEYGEFYIRTDADGDFVTEDIMLVMNLQTGYPVFYDYVANVTSDGLRPFYPIVPSPVLNRWYGQGAIERFETHQETVDLMVNRRNRAQGESGSVTFWRPDKTVEGENNPNLMLRGGRTYTPLGNNKPEDILFRVPLYDIESDNLTQELEFFMQLAMNESGVQHANDGAAAGSDTTKLATGIRNIEKSGQELFGVIISELEGCITPAAQAFVTTLYANLKDEETFRYFEGDVPMEMTVAGRDIKGLRFDVETLLTRFRDEQVLASSAQASQLVQEYYSLPPQLQVILSGLYVDMLKALQIQRAADYIIPQPVPLVPPMGGVSQPQGAPKQGKAPPALL